MRKGGIEIPPFLLLMLTHFVPFVHFVVGVKLVIYHQEHEEFEIIH